MNIGRKKLGVIGVTVGDAAGIGPEVVRAALAVGALDDGFEYQIVGGSPPEVVCGQPTPASARAAWEALEEAATGAINGEYAAIVTGPVCKQSLYRVGFRFPGQTEFFADRCQTRNFAMLLSGGSMTVALLTTHLPLAEAVRQLAADEIVRVGGLLARFLRLRVGNRPISVAVAGLNPHAGEDGSLGREEIDTIGPAVERLQSRRANPGLHVPRPGLDPAQAARVSRRGERHGRAAGHPDQPRSRHRLRHRGPRKSQSGQHDRRPPVGGGTRAQEAGCGRAGRHPP